jgi:HemY protein
MKTWVLLLTLLLVACAAAFGWQWLAADPGAVSVRFGDWHVDTTLVFAVVALLVLWGLLNWLARLLRWPLRAWAERRRRRGRERIAAGLTALAEGDHRRALRELERASHHAELRAPAMLATARAAHARGEAERAQAALDEAAQQAPAAALTLRARFLLEHGKADEALAVLKPQAQTGNLPPAGWRQLAEAGLLCGDATTAMQALDALARSDAHSPDAIAALRARVLTAALTGAVDAEALDKLWSELPRALRATPEAIAAYARRAAGVGRVLAAMDEIETALRRNWSERLLRVYGELGEVHADVRVQRAESWLAAHPDSPELLLALGRMCIQTQLWGKAREYLERGLAFAPNAALWEALGDCRSAQSVSEDAAICYRNALRSARGEATQALAETARAPLDTRASIREERSEHGVPRLATPSDR